MMVFPDALDDPVIDPGYEEVLRRVDDWDCRLRALYCQLSAWLPEGWRSDESQGVVMREPIMAAVHMPTRSLPVLNVYDTSEWRAKLIPTGLWVVGANGRIDVLTDRTNALIVDTSEAFAPPSWHLLDPALRWDRKVLTRETWESAIRA